MPAVVSQVNSFEEQPRYKRFSLVLHICGKSSIGTSLGYKYNCKMARDGRVPVNFASLISECGDVP